jgi:rhamnose utilization protein RhaD (predicted bifunctional aldolase and dehydrogenase)/NAD(P)-dependent dehydrogenase (short-subunit alcohol dehydrogenase family)
MQSRWADPEEKDELSQRVHTSKLLGMEEELVLHGGGNTSVKVEEKDHTGRKVEVLRVKGSGSDLAKVTKSDFTGLRMEDLLAAREIKAMDDVQMVSFFLKSMVDPTESAPSVESFLHAFLPFKFVDHSHADSVLALTNTELSDEDLKKALGNVVVIPYVSPGFKLAREILKHVEEIERSEGLVLRKHGLFTFSNDARNSYEKHIQIVTRAEEYISKHVREPLFTKKYSGPGIDENTFLPQLRGIVSQNHKKVLRIESQGFAREVASSSEAEELCLVGPPTSDMIIRTKYEFMYLANPADLNSSISAYVKKYEEEHKRYASRFPMHDPFPAVIVVRGYGVITQANTWKQADIIMDQALHSFAVNVKTIRLSRNSPISREDAFAMEYWPLQEGKLRKLQPRKLDGTISVVTGAANGIGLEAFHTLASNGSHVVAIDVDEKVASVADEIYRITGTRNLPVRVDLSDETEVVDAFRRILREFGGVDIVFNNAGILKTAPLDQIKIEEMDRVFAVNGRGTFLITREAFRIMKVQGIGGNFVFNITKNLTNPGAQMAMYGSTKAFAAHISHYVAKEGGKYRIRSNIINPDKVFRGSKIWEGGILESRAKAKGQTIEEYKTQNLLGIEVLPSHVVGVLMALIDEPSFGATTDAMIPIDGGVV